MRLEGKKKVSFVGSKRDEKKNNYVSNSVCVFVIWYKKKNIFFPLFRICPPLLVSIVAERSYVFWLTARVAFLFCFTFY